MCCFFGILELGIFFECALSTILLICFVTLYCVKANCIHSSSWTSLKGKPISFLVRNLLLILSYIFLIFKTFLFSLLCAIQYLNFFSHFVLEHIININLSWFIRNISLFFNIFSIINANPKSFRLWEPAMYWLRLLDYY